MCSVRLSIIIAIVLFGWDARVVSRMLAAPAREPLGQSSRLTSLVISEVMYHPLGPAGEEELEFIELFNALDTAEDISGYQLSGDISFSFPPGTIIPGRAFLVVARNPARLQAAYGLSGVLGPFDDHADLPNDTGLVQLRHRTGAVFLEVEYGTSAPWPIAADGAGHSLVLARPSFGEADPRAWSASANLGGSPGLNESESSAHSPIVINEFLANTDAPQLDYIELFNRSPQAILVSGFVLTDDAGTNKFVLPENRTIPPGGFLAFSEAELKFALSSNGETIYLKDIEGGRVIDAVRFGGQESGVATGRFPDGGEEFYRLRSQTPAAPNSVIRPSDVVINEIMYHPISRNDADQFIELYNQSSSAISLAGWRLEDGVTFEFPAGAVIPPDSYVVVAKDATRLNSNHSGRIAHQVWGDFSGRLSWSGERVALTMPIEDPTAGNNEVIGSIVVDEVTYRDGGKWGQWSDGGGSSLERVDPRGDGRLASNWADSDETSKAPWTHVSVSGRLDNGNVSADQLQVLLQGAGECLIDDVEVLNAAGVNQIANSTFENNATSWTGEGTESQSSWEQSEGFESSRSYHVRAADRGDNQINRVRTPLNSELPSGSIGTIRAKVRWLKGRPELLFRLRGNWLEAPVQMALPGNLGTPGSRNSRFVPNAPPAIWDVGHSPILPRDGETVVVTARASDPDGIGAVRLSYRVDPSPSRTTVQMNDSGSGGDTVAGDGIYSAQIPGQSTGVLVAFYVEATDAASSAATQVFPDQAPADEGLIRFGEILPQGTFPVYRIWMTRETFNTWAGRNELNNTPLPITFVLGGERVIHNARGLYAGSPYIAPGYNNPAGRPCGYSLSFPSDDRFLGDTDLVLDWPGGHGGENTAIQEQMAYWMADQMDFPYSHRYHIRLHVNGVTDMQRGTVFEAVNQPAGDFIDAWSPEDTEGDFYKIDRAFEFNDGGGLIADPQPRLQNYTTTGGAKKTERYRWTWLKRSSDSAHDYTNIFHLVDALNASSPEPYTSQSEALIDIEEWMGMLAIEHIIVNFDAYGHEIGKNMYAYKPKNGRWQLYMFDLDWLMLAAAGRRSSYSASAAPLFNSEDPTITRMYNHPPFRRAYFRAVKKAVDGPLLAANCNPVMDAKHASLVANGVTMCDGQPLAAPTAVKTWFSQRRTALLNQLTQVAAPFAITSNDGADFSSVSHVVALTGTAPIEVKGLRVNGVEYPVTWTSVSQWALNLALLPGHNAITVEAYDAEGSLLPNYTDRINVRSDATPEAVMGRVVINEIMAQPSIPGAEFVELLNTSDTTTFDLSKWRVDGLDFTFPAGSLIEPGTYGVITKDRAAFTSAYGNIIPIAGEFAGVLNPKGETLRLISPDSTGAPGLIVDTVSFESSLPWPAAGTGISLQLIDPTQDNFRVSNWSVSQPGGAPTEEVNWQYVTATGTASSSRLYVYLTSAGDVYLDDLRLVSGEVAGVGENLIANGSFDGDFPGAWQVSPNHAASSLSTSIKHSGNASLHMIASAPGTTQGSSIWQDVGPLVPDATYTLSYWYLPSTNGSGITIRLSGSGISSSHSIAPAETQQRLLSTPGSANSVRQSLPALAPIWINEVVPNNTSGLADNSGDRDPWVELYNAGTTAVNLNGWYLTDNFSSLQHWAFPAGTTLGPGEFRIVWLDGEPQEGTLTEWHTTFRITPNSGALGLVAPSPAGSTLVDYIKFTGLGADQSLGYFPDGQPGDRQRLNSGTPGTANNNTTAPLLIFINEWLAANTSGLENPADGNFDDWLELYNPNDFAVSLAGYWLSDSLTNVFARWQFPPGTTIGPRGFLLVWADDDTDQNGGSPPSVHAGFRLSQDGEVIALFAPEGRLVDAVEFGPQSDDVSQGRSPDGGSTLAFFSSPTPGSANMSSGLQPEMLPACVSDEGGLVLSWEAEVGRTYRIEVSDQLGGGTWVTVVEAAATQPIQTHVVPMTPAGQRFYRLVRLSP